MRALVREVVDDPARFPGVRLAKVAGPSVVSTRAEGIVVYTADDDASDRVVRWLGQYQVPHPTEFDTISPA